MKKCFVLLLAVLVVGSIALAVIACGDEEETATTATTEVASTALSYSEAKDNVGATDLWFTGTVLEVVDKGFKYIIPIGTDEDNLNLAITAEDADKFGGQAALDLLVGKTVEVTGLVELMPFDNPTYEIKLTDASQLKVVE